MCVCAVVVVEKPKCVVEKSKSSPKVFLRDCKEMDPSSLCCFRKGVKKQEVGYYIIRSEWVQQIIII